MKIERIELIFPGEMMPCGDSLAKFAPDTIDTTLVDVGDDPDIRFRVIIKTPDSGLYIYGRDYVDVRFVWCRGISAYQMLINLERIEAMGSWDLADARNLIRRKSAG